MSNLREAAQQALDALDSKHDMSKAEWRVLQYRAFTALRAALEQPEPIIESEITPDKDGPVAVLLEYENGERELRFKNNGWPAKETPLFTHPPRREWRGLTEEEISDIFEAEPRYHYPPIGATDREFARAIEQALKEKNQ